MAVSATAHVSFNATMDVSGTVSKLMAVKSAEITKVQNKQTVLQTDIAAWGDVSSSLSTLSSDLNTLQDWDTWNTMKVTSSNSEQFTATAASTASAATYSVSISHIAQAHTVASSSASTLGLSGVTDTLVGKVAGLIAGDQFKIGSTSTQIVTIDATDTLSSLCGKINTASDLLPAADQVTASILDNRLVLSRTSTGSTSLGLTNLSGSPLDRLGVKTGASFNTELTAPLDALFSVNGLSITRSSNANLTDVIPGVTLNLLQPTENSDGSIGTGYLTVAHDTDIVKTAINSVITDYNAVVKKIGSYTSIDLSNPKQPITGELQDDLMIMPILYNLRKLFIQDKQPNMNSSNASYTYNGQTGIMSSLAAIGVGTSSEVNSLSITDSARLESALTNHFSEVEQLMRGVQTDSGLQHGVAADLYTYTSNLSESMTGQIAQHVATIQEKYNSLGADILKMTSEASSYEQALWTQFDAMDQAMQNMQSQVSYITNAFGSK